MPRRTDTRQPGLALVRPSAEPVTDANRAAAARRCRIGLPGEELWLEWRVERQEYAVAWYDRTARTRRRKQIGIGAGEGNDPPRSAIEALAAHFAARTRPAAAQAPAEVGLSTILTRYLNEHCLPESGTGIAAPERQAYAVLSIEKYLDHRRHQPGGGRLVTIADLGREFLADFAKFRRGDGIADSTIKKELGTLRAAVQWAADGEIIGGAPRLPKLIGFEKLQTRGRKVAYTLPQIAAILEAAWSDERRHHVHLFAIAMLASHARTEAILECDLDAQYADGVIDWLMPGRHQTKKRRSMTPVGPTLASWIDDRSGKLIRYRAMLARSRWRDPLVPEYHESKPTMEIIKSFGRTVVAAGLAHPSLRLALPVLGPDGEQQTRLVKAPGKQGRGTVHEEPIWKPLGSPNTFRHTVHTQLRRVGVPIAQIEAASGHRDPGTGGHYDHLDAKHDMKDLVIGIEQVFADLGQYTKVHLRSQCGPKVIDMGAARAAKAS